MVTFVSYLCNLHQVTVVLFLCFSGAYVCHGQEATNKGNSDNRLIEKLHNEGLCIMKCVYSFSKDIKGLLQGTLSLQLIFDMKISWDWTWLLRGLE